MTKFVIKIFRADRENQLETIYVNYTCVSSTVLEALADIQRTIILARNKDGLFFHDRIDFTDLRRYIGPLDRVNPEMMVEFIDKMPDELVSELFEYLYTAGNYYQYNRAEDPDDWVTIRVEEWIDPEFVGLGDLVYGNYL